MSVFIQRAPKLRSVNAAFADTLAEPLAEPVPQPDFDDEDTQPSIPLPGAEEDFGDAPTVPGFSFRADGSVRRELGGHQGQVARQREMLREGQWDRALRAVAFAVKRVFASHSIKGLS